MTRLNFGDLPDKYKDKLPERELKDAEGDFEFTIPGELPTMNEIINASKSHWIYFKRLKEEYQSKVEYYIVKCDVPFYEELRLEAVYYRKDRKFDPDNISAGARKIILDALQEVGCIENDGWKQIKSFSEEWKVDKDNPRTVVKLKAVD